MRYLSVTEIAKKWNVSERSVRNYCAQGRVIGAFLAGKTWKIPENAEKPERTNKRKEQPVTLLDILNVDDVIETVNHFRCIDMIIDNAKATLTEKLIKEIHLILKNGSSDFRKDWFAVGDYKKMSNEVGGIDTALPEDVTDRMKELLTEYNTRTEKTFEDNLKLFYYRGLKEWDIEKGYLTDTCLTAQDKYKTYLDYFRIRY